MTLVIDASALVAVVAEEVHSAAARAASRNAALIAPDLILAEIANVLWKKVRRGMISPERALTAIHDVGPLLTLLEPAADLAAAALALALRRDHPAYDCFYVVLAQREGAVLLTADIRLAERFASDADIRLLGA